MPKAPWKKQEKDRSSPLGSTSGNASRAKKSSRAADAKREQPNPARESNEPSQWNYLLLVAMTPTDPQVNRLFSLPPTLTFKQFHDVLQVSCGWANCHMHKVDIQWVEEEDLQSPFIKSLVSRPMNDFEDMKEEEEADWTLADVYEKPEWKDKVSLTYEYDMGDSWEHNICLLGRQRPSS